MAFCSDVTWELSVILFVTGWKDSSMSIIS